MRGLCLAIRVLRRVSENVNKPGLPFSGEISHAKTAVRAINTRNENGGRGQRRTWPCDDEEAYVDLTKTTGDGDWEFQKRARFSKSQPATLPSRGKREERDGEKRNRGDVFEDLLRRHLNLFPPQSGIPKPLKGSPILSRLRGGCARWSRILMQIP